MIKNQVSAGGVNTEYEVVAMAAERLGGRIVWGDPCVTWRAASPLPDMEGSGRS